MARKSAAALALALLGSGCGGGGGGGAGSSAHAPTAQVEGYSVDEDAILVISEVDGVLANDSDSDGDALSATLVTPAQFGSVILQLDGAFTYTPPPDFFGDDFFVYQAWDGSTGSTATVAITVNPVDDPTVPIYGADAWGLYQYAAVGEARTTVCFLAGEPKGFVVDRAGDSAYVVSYDGTVSRIELSDGSSTWGTSLPAGVVVGPRGLDYDSQDRLYTVGYSDGTVIRIDPSMPEPSWNPVGAVPLTGFVLDIAVGPDDKLYYCEDRPDGDASIYCFDPATGDTINWTEELNVADVFPGGIAINAQGEAFVSFGQGAKVLRFRNSDGDPVADEVFEWGSFPASANAAYGIALGPDGEVLVNLVPNPGTGAVLSLRDANGDGDALDPGEAVQFSAEGVEVDGWISAKH